METGFGIYQSGEEMKFQTLKCFFGFHQMIEIITIIRGDIFNLNYFHCKHCGYDALQPRLDRLYGKGNQK